MFVIYYLYSTEARLRRASLLWRLMKACPMTVSLTQASLSTELINVHNMIVATRYASNIDRYILIAYLIISVVVKRVCFIG